MKIKNLLIAVFAASTIFTTVNANAEVVDRLDRDYPAVIEYQLSAEVTNRTIDINGTQVDAVVKSFPDLKYEVNILGNGAKATYVVNDVLISAPASLSSGDLNSALANLNINVQVSPQVYAQAQNLVKGQANS